MVLIVNNYLDSVLMIGYYSSMQYMHGQVMKKAGIPNLVLEDALAKEAPIASLQTPAEYHHPNARISTEEQDQMLREAAATGSVTSVELKYGVARGYLRAAMTRRFGSLEAMKQVLLGLVTENAIAVQMVAQEKIGELSAPQAVFAGKMLVDTMEKVEKSIQNTPKTVNFAQLNQVGETLKALRAVVDKRREAEAEETLQGRTARIQEELPLSPSVSGAGFAT